MRKLLLSTALLTAIALPAYANNTAHIHVHRDFTLRYATDGVTITVNNSDQCDLAIGEDCDFDLSPGKYRIGADVSHWIKADEHALSVVSLTGDETVNYEAGFTCETWYTTGGPAGGGCAGRLTFVEVSKEHAENAKGTPGY